MATEVPVMLSSIYLIPISTTVESGDSGRKRKRNAETTEGLLAILNLHSERLRHCSEYFQILLDERWSDSERKSPTEFSLEAHTDVKYYEDGFSRMYAPNFSGIPSVEHARELLKVASQIEFAEVMDEIMDYLYRELILFPRDAHRGNVYFLKSVAECLVP